MKVSALPPRDRLGLEGEIPVFKTPLSFTVPSFLLGAAMALDMGATLRPQAFRSYLTAHREASDAKALLSDFAVIGDDLLDAFEDHERSPGEA